MKTLLVKAADPAVPVPRADSPRRHIDATPQRVPDEAYYRRRIRKGELVIQPEPAARPVRRAEEPS